MTNHVRISEKVYWVTGAGSGIGKALALQLAEQGHKVILTSRSVEALRDVASHNSDQFVLLPADVSNQYQLSGIFRASGITKIDGAFLSAGICEYVDIPDWDIDSIQKTMDVNFFGIVNSCIELLPILTNSPFSKISKINSEYKPFIVGISSMSTYLGFPRAEAYGASKAAMSYFLESLRADVQQSVDITIVYPGFVQTPLTESNDFPMPVMVSADYAANLILRKLKRRPRKIVFPLRLHIILKLASIFSSFWYSMIIPKLTRSRVSK